MITWAEREELVRLAYVDKLGYAHCATCHQQGAGTEPVQEVAPKVSLGPTERCDSCGGEFHAVRMLAWVAVEETPARIF